MNKRTGLLAVVCGTAALIYACGGTSSSDDANQLDSGSDSTTNDSCGDSSNNDSGGNDAGGNDTGVGDSGGCGDACASFAGDCDDAGACPSGEVCVSKTAGVSNTRQCYPIPKCGCTGTNVCNCIGSCACGTESCTPDNGGGIRCIGPISRREFKTDIDYIDDAERASLADQALETRLAEYRYKTEPEDAKRHLGFIIDDMPASSPAVQADQTHVDLYGYTTMLLATVQEQQKQIDELKKQVDALKKR
jgi:hypothetical protein